MSEKPKDARADAPEEDEAHRKFREALERKKSAEHASGDAASAQSGVGPSHSNTKTTRQFRRKSGG